MGVYFAIGDSQGTVDLSSNYIDYSPSNAPDRIDTVTERCSIQFWGTVTATQTSIRQLGRLLTKAREYAESAIGEPVYILFRWTDTDDIYRSQIVDGYTQPSSGATRAGQAGGGVASPSYLKFTLTIVRENFWEDNTERTLPIVGAMKVDGTVLVHNSLYPTAVTDESLAVTSGGTAAYSGTFANIPVLDNNDPPVLTYQYSGGTYSATFVYGTTSGTVEGTGIDSGTLNYRDGVWAITFSASPGDGTILATYNYGYCNRVYLPGTAIAGDLPAPIKIKLDWGSTSGSLWRPTTVFLGAGHGDIVDFQNSYEAGDYESLTAPGSFVVDSDALGGSYCLFNTSASRPSMITWNLTNPEKLKGEYIIPIYRNYAWSGTVLANAYMHNYVQVALAWEGYNREAVTQLVTSGFIKCLPVSPYQGMYDPNFTAGSVEMGIGWTLDGTVPLAVDFVQFFPTNAGYGELRLFTNSVMYQYVIDGIDRKSYCDPNWAGTAPTFVGGFYYDYLEVYPGDNWNMYMLTSEGAGGGGPITHFYYETGLDITYRPRKRTL